MLAGNDFVAGERSEISQAYINQSGMKMGNTRSLKNMSHNINFAMAQDENYNE